MPYISAWFHVVFSTKNRYPFLNKQIRPKVLEHIKMNAKEKKIFLDCVNGHDDHIHFLLSLSCDQTLSKVIQLVKGESSFWINKEKLIAEKFGWQDEYFAVSVSYSKLKQVREYIYGQESHHQKRTFQQEYDEFIRNYEFRK